MATSMGPPATLQLGPPDPTVFCLFVDHLRGVTSLLYGRRMEEVMRYWDEDQPGWTVSEHEFA